MADPSTPSPPPELSAPTGAPIYAWFDGVIAGDRGGADSALHGAAAAMERLGLGRADLELEGERFALHFRGESVEGDRLDEEGKRRFIAILEEVVRAAGTSRPLESTLLCTEVHSDRTVETLFALRSGHVDPLSRVRPVEAEDCRRAPLTVRAPPGLPARGRWRAVALLLALVAIGAIAASWSGLIDRFTSPDPSGLPILTTEFGDRLAVTVRRRYGEYRVEIRRSPTFPDSEDALALWRDRLTGTRERIAWQALAGAGRVYVHSLGEGSRRLHTATLDLRPLVVDRHPVVAARLRADPRTKGFAISPVATWGR